MKKEMASIDQECENARTEVQRMFEQRDQGMAACNVTQKQIKIKRDAYAKSIKDFGDLDFENNADQEEESSEDEGEHVKDDDDNGEVEISLSRRSALVSVVPELPPSSR